MSEGPTPQLSVASRRGSATAMVCGSSDARSPTSVATHLSLTSY
jgi:hypothetical protein